MKKILIFGTGNEYKKYKKWIVNADIVALIDNDIKKQGTTINKIPVISVDEAKSFSVDCVYIMSSLYAREMSEQLKGLGIPEEKINYLFDLVDLGMKYKVPVCKFKMTEKGTKKIALLSDNLQLSGAQFALLNMAILLKRNEYKVIIASPESGKLGSYIHQVDIPLILDERLRIGKIHDIEWLDDFDLIIVNTILNYHLLLKRNTNIPVIWWLHETDYFYNLVIHQKIKVINPENLFIYAVSNLAKKPLLKIRKDILIQDLPVYIKQDLLQDKIIKRYKEKIVFAIIGVVCELKGQDILLNALNLLSEDENRQIEVWFIGREDTDFIRKYGAIIQEHTNVYSYGELEKKDLRKLYRQIDVIICASRSENLCMAVLEGAERNIPPIISSAAAVSEYFTDGWDGIIFCSENEKELAEKIHWCIQNPHRLKEMGKHAYDVYKNNFSESIFEKILLRAIQKAWK